MKIIRILIVVVIVLVFIISAGCVSYEDIYADNAEPIVGMWVVKEDYNEFQNSVIIFYDDNTGWMRSTLNDGSIVLFDFDWSKESNFHYNMHSRESGFYYNVKLTQSGNELLYGDSVDYYMKYDRTDFSTTLSPVGIWVGNTRWEGAVSDSIIRLTINDDLSGDFMINHNYNVNNDHFNDNKNRLPFLHKFIGMEKEYIDDPNQCLLALMCNCKIKGIGSNVHRIIATDMTVVVLSNYVKSVNTVGIVEYEHEEYGEHFLCGIQQISDTLMLCYMNDDTEFYLYKKNDY